MKIVLIIFVVLIIALCIASWCKIAGRASRQEEQENPCVECLRWDECNGVDPACPWRC